MPARIAAISSTGHAATTPLQGKAAVDGRGHAAASLAACDPHVEQNCAKALLRAEQLSQLLNSPMPQ